MIIYGDSSSLYNTSRVCVCVCVLSSPLLLPVVAIVFTILSLLFGSSLSHFIFFLFPACIFVVVYVVLKPEDWCRWRWWDGWVMDTGKILANWRECVLYSIIISLVHIKAIMVEVTLQDCVLPPRSQVTNLNCGMTVSHLFIISLSNSFPPLSVLWLSLSVLSPGIQGDSQKC